MSQDLFLDRPVLEDLPCFRQENLESSELAKDLGLETFASTDVCGAPRAPAAVLLLVYVDDVTGILRVCLILNLLNQRSRVFLFPTTKNMNNTNPWKVDVKANK